MMIFFVFVGGGTCGLENAAFSKASKLAFLTNQRPARQICHISDPSPSKMRVFLWKCRSVSPFSFGVEIFLRLAPPLRSISTEITDFCGSHRFRCEFATLAQSGAAAFLVPECQEETWLPQQNSGVSDIRIFAKKMCQKMHERSLFWLQKHVFREFKTTEQI